MDVKEAYREFFGVEAKHSGTTVNYSVLAFAEHYAKLKAGQNDTLVSELPDWFQICNHFSVDKDYKPDGAPYEPETAIKNKYRREGAIWLLNLIKEKAH